MHELLGRGPGRALPEVHSGLGSSSQQSRKWRLLGPGRDLEAAIPGYSGPASLGGAQGWPLRAEGSRQCRALSSVLRRLELVPQALESHCCAFFSDSFSL